MPWRFSISLATAFLAAMSSLAFAQGPSAWSPPANQAMMPACPPGMMPGYGPGCPPGALPTPQLVDPDIFYDRDAPIDLVFAETLRRGWLRVDFLNWNIKDPGGRLLGAELATLGPTPPFQAFDPGNIPRGPGLLGAFVPDTSDVRFDNLPGMRLTIGAPTQWGAFEADIWAVLTASTTISIDPALNTDFTVPVPFLTIIPAVTLNVNGAPSDTQMILFDNGYDAELTSSMWGTQANWIANPLTPNNTLSVSPMFGIRYVKFEEALKITGSDVFTGTNPHITSKSNNNFVGPQVGLRATLASKWLSLSAEPKLLLGINRHQDSVRTSQIFDVTNPNTFTTNEDTDFAPAFNIPAKATLHLSENFSLFAGYELLWLSNASRATEQIVYDSGPLATDSSLIRVKKHREPVYAHGLMVGAEFRFR